MTHPAPRFIPGLWRPAPERLRPSADEIVLVGAALGGAVYGASYLLQKRLTTEVQSLAPRT